MLKILLASALMLVSILSMGQAVIGIKAGGNAYLISSSLPSDFTFHWQAGFFSRASINEAFYLQPELLYIAKGSTVKLNNSSINVKLNYIELPLTASYKIYNKLFVEAGFDISYMFKVQKSNTADSLLRPSSFSPLSFGLLFGMGIDLRNFIVTARYDLGITKLILESDPANKNSPLINSYNRGFQISIGFVL